MIGRRGDRPSSHLIVATFSSGEITTFPKCRAALRHRSASRASSNANTRSITRPPLMQRDGAVHLLEHRHGADVDPLQADVGEDGGDVQRLGGAGDGAIRQPALPGVPLFYINPCMLNPALCS